MKNSSPRKNLLAPETVTGSEMLLRMLLLEGVECVFGYPGGSVLYIYDAMRNHRDFRHLLTRHEQGAVHAADGYARATGKTGVCFATSGPGALNLVTGIATAFMDSVPLVVITGNAETTSIGTNAFQEADIIGITQPITKHSYFVQRAEEIPKVLKEAFHIAGTGRKGPVLVDIPKNVSAQTAKFVYPETVRPSGYRPKQEIYEERLDELLRAIHSSQKPVLLSGGGVIQSGASRELMEFAERARIPVATTLMGLGGFPADHPLWLGMPGMHGTYAANRALIECDLLISVGARFDDRVTLRLDGFAPDAVIAHIDIDAAEIGKLVPTSIPVRGDARQVLKKLVKRMNPVFPKQDWLRYLQRLKKEFPLSYRDSGSELKPQYVIEMISETTNGEAVVTTDVGQHQMWTAQFYRFKHPRSLITSGGLGTMGFGFPSAIGAQIGRPDRLVVSINGDGGMQMCARELAVCAICNIPVKIVVINNQTLGMIKQWQEIVYDGRHNHIDLAGSPDFVRLAEAYGIKGLRADNKRDAQKVWQEAMDTPGPVLIDFIVSKEEYVMPMVPQGKALEDMILEMPGPSPECPQ